MCNQSIHPCSSSWCDDDRCTSCIGICKNSDLKVEMDFPVSKYFPLDYEEEYFNDEYYCKYDYETDYWGDNYETNTSLEATYSDDDYDNYYYDDYVEDNYDILNTHNKFMYT